MHPPASRQRCHGQRRAEASGLWGLPKGTRQRVGSPCSSERGEMVPSASVARDSPFLPCQPDP